MIIWFHSKLRFFKYFLFRFENRKNGTNWHKSTFALRKWDAVFSKHREIHLELRMKKLCSLFPIIWEHDAFRVFCSNRANFRFDKVWRRTVARKITNWSNDCDTIKFSANHWTHFVNGLMCLPSGYTVLIIARRNNLEFL